ncbi:hypothetical protein LJR153_004834 [Paenibacillus sp. LjRoot153]|uniref:hypothetical protein n=1 Tax=Paenibacillus sp. LjRoot153 TaxID=3342270 RepID=UPI003ECCC93F
MEFTALIVEKGWPGRNALARWQRRINGFYVAKLDEMADILGVNGFSTGNISQSWLLGQNSLD